MSKNELIDYRYLNMDTKSFEINEAALIKNVGKGGMLRAIPNYSAKQVLISGGRKPFSEFDSIQLCRKLTGLDRFGNMKANHE